MERPAPWTPPLPLPSRLETPRIVIRYHAPADAPSMIEALDEDRTSFLPWLPWVLDDNRAEHEAIFNIERFRRMRETKDPVPLDFVMGLFDRASGHLLGGCGLHRIDRAFHEADIGYWIRPSRRGQGFCTEAVEHLITWTLHPASDGGWGFRRATIHCSGSNVASRRVPEKLGLRHETTKVAHRWEDGNGWVDTLAWGVTAEEWGRKKGSGVRGQGPG